MINLSTKSAEIPKPAPAVKKPVPLALAPRPATVTMRVLGGRSDFAPAAPPRPVAIDGGAPRTRSPVSIAQAELAGADPASLNGSKYYGWAKTGKTDWCASFVSWTYAQAGIPLGPSPHGASGVNGIPHCDNLKRWFEETPGFQWQPAGNGYRPQPGDVVLFDYDDDGHMDHTGIVESYDPATGQLTTIEGNAGGDGEAGDGDGTLVRRTYENMDDVAGFGHYAGTPSSGGGGGGGGGGRMVPLAV